MCTIRSNWAQFFIRVIAQEDFGSHGSSPWGANSYGMTLSMIRITKEIYMRESPAISPADVDTRSSLQAYPAQREAMQSCIRSHGLGWFRVCGTSAADG